MQVEAHDSNPRMINTSSFLSHFLAMMGPYGLYQHATIRVPLLSEGYCTDDNARAVYMLSRLLSTIPPKDKDMVRDLLLRCWRFLCEAEKEPGQFHNFRSSKGVWLAHGESEDMYARLIRALVEVILNQQLSDMHPKATSMLRPLLTRASTMQAPRFWAECLIALADMPDGTLPSDAKKSLMKTGQEMLEHYWNTHSSPTWMWFEDTMTYANALLPHGLLAANMSEDMLHQSAAFLIKTTIQDDMCIPIGSNGWYPRGGVPSHDNQQAIEADTMFDFLLAYYGAFPERVNVEIVAAPYRWFLGHNTKGIVMADESTGACLDGLFLDGPNPNYGAESMLAYQHARILLQNAPLPIVQYLYGSKDH